MGPLPLGAAVSALGLATSIGAVAERQSRRGVASESSRASTPTFSVPFRTGDRGERRQLQQQSCADEPSDWQVQGISCPQFGELQLCTESGGYGPVGVHPAPYHVKCHLHFTS